MYFIKTLYREILVFLVGVICNAIVAWITNLKLSMMIEIIIPFTCLMVVMAWFRLNHEALKKKHLALEAEKQNIKSVVLLLFDKMKGQMTLEQRLQFLIQLEPANAVKVVNQVVDEQQLAQMEEEIKKKLKDDYYKNIAYA